MDSSPIIQFKRIAPERDHDLPLPRYMTEDAAGMDLVAGVPNDLTLNPGDITLVPTGFAMAVPRGYEAQIRPRSGIAVKHGVSVVNSPGTIDADYRGEVKIALINLGKAPYLIRRGDRIAQMVIKKVTQARFVVVEELDDTKRGAGGFGHTGVS